MRWDSWDAGCAGRLPQASATAERVERFPGAGVHMGEREERGERTARVRAALEDSIATQRVIESFRAGHKLLAFGNGGSASDAEHLCVELAGRYVLERPGLPAIAL